jgi:calcium-dependent protein kinase
MDGYKDMYGDLAEEKVDAIFEAADIDGDGEI